MKAKVWFYEKDDAEKARKLEELGLPAPKRGTFCADVYFNPDFISTAYLNEDGEIVAVITGDVWIFEFDEFVWDAIKESLR